MAVAVMGKELRLDKYLTEMNLGTRSQMKEAAKKGRILVNGAVEKKTDRKIDPEKDSVSFDGKTVNYRRYEYYMLHKPNGVVSATEDNVHPVSYTHLNDAVTIPGIDIMQIPIVKGDAKSISIAAASILAKVTRDHMMVEYDALYPEYGFAKHKGYGTAVHIKAIKEYGPCPIHRRSFIKNFV